VVAEALTLAGLAALAAEDAHAALTAVHGIGPWTADIYLLSCLGHADALQGAARVAFALPARPSTIEMQALAESWRPWRAVAARVLWGYYRAVAEAAKAAGIKAPRPPQPKQRVGAPAKPRAAARPKRRA